MQTKSLPDNLNNMLKLVDKKPTSILLVFMALNMGTKGRSKSSKRAKRSKRARLHLVGNAQKERDYNWFKALKKSEITITVTG